MPNFSFQNCKNVPETVCTKIEPQTSEPNCVEEIIGQECKNITREEPQNICSNVPQEICQDVQNEVCNPIQRNECNIVPISKEVRECRTQPRYLTEIFQTS